MRPVPIAAAVTAVLFMAAAVVLVLFADDTKGDTGQHVIVILSVILAAIPGLLAAAFAEQAVRHVKEGSVAESARIGARQAIRDEEVLTRAGPVVTEELRALRRLLEEQRGGTMPGGGPT